MPIVGGFEPLALVIGESGQAFSPEAFSMRRQEHLTAHFNFVALALEAGVVLPDSGLIVDQVQRQVIGEFHAFKKCTQAEVVGLQQRIELVVVTPAAGHRESQESTAGRLGEIGHQFGSAAVLFVEQPGRIVVRA